jgi:uncharacterized protein YndB with AHSA1/START domain
MKELQYSVTIDEPREKVWDTMLGRDTYEKWTAAAWPGSSFEGDWSEGSQMRFVGADGGGGTLAKITSVDPYTHIDAEHIAVIAEDGSEDRNSDVAKTWVGTKESYSFNARNGSTEVVVDIATYPEWESMFNEGWPGALQALKALCEES